MTLLYNAVRLAEFETQNTSEYTDLNNRYQKQYFFHRFKNEYKKINMKNYGFNVYITLLSLLALLLYEDVRVCVFYLNRFYRWMKKEKEKEEKQMKKKIWGYYNQIADVFAFNYTIVFLSFFFLLCAALGNRHAEKKLNEHV